jgi:G patch domain-containing protein 1
MSDSDDDDYVYIGTALVDEDDARVGARKQAMDPSVTRSLPVHKQEVTDEQGRKRFHGAFTGGFSAGYFNTVGSKVSATACQPPSPCAASPSLGSPTPP